MYHKTKIHIETTVGYFIYLFGLHWGPYWLHDETMNFFACAQHRHKESGLRALQDGMRTPQIQRRLGCAHPRHMCAPQAQGQWTARTSERDPHNPGTRKIELRAPQAYTCIPGTAKWAARTSEWDAHTPDTRMIGLRAPQAYVRTPGTETIDCAHFRMGCAHPRY